jgi:hypothetical protein
MILIAQNNDSIKVIELNKKIDKLNEIIETKEEEDILASFKLIKKPLIYKGKLFEIEKVELSISNGLLARARVFFKNEFICETHKRDAIQLYQLNKVISEIKLHDIQTDSAIFNLSEVVMYIDELDKANYLPEDNLITLKNDEANSEKKMFIKTDINSFVDFRIYTDMLALLNKEGNGLVQSEVSSKITINSNIIKRHFYFFNYIEPFFKLSKFDNQYKNQTVSDSIPKLSINRLKLNQLSYIDLGFRFNIFKFSLFQHTFDLVNVGMDYKYSDILLQSTNEVKTLNTFGYYVETRGQLLKYKNFGFEYAVQSYFQKIQDSSIEGYNLWDPYLITEFSLFYHPKSNPLNMIFVRFKNMQTGLSDDFYSVLQVGYKSKLSFKK